MNILERLIIFREKVQVKSFSKGAKILNAERFKKNAGGDNYDFYLVLNLMQDPTAEKIKRKIFLLQIEDVVPSEIESRNDFYGTVLDGTKLYFVFVEKEE